MQGLEGREPLQNTHFNLETGAACSLQSAFGQLLRTLNVRQRAGPLGINQNEDHVQVNAVGKEPDRCYSGGARCASAQSPPA